MMKNYMDGVHFHLNNIPKNDCVQSDDTKIKKPAQKSHDKSLTKFWPPASLSSINCELKSHKIS